MLVWGDPDDEETPCVTFEDASSAIVVYEPGRAGSEGGAEVLQDDSASTRRCICPMRCGSSSASVQRQPQVAADGEADECSTRGSRGRSGTSRTRSRTHGRVPMVSFRTGRCWPRTDLGHSRGHRYAGRDHLLWNAALYRLGLCVARTADRDRCGGAEDPDP